MHEPGVWLCMGCERHLNRDASGNITRELDVAYQRLGIRAPFERTPGMPIRIRKCRNCHRGGFCMNFKFYEHDGEM